jgi:cytochrome b561
VSLEEKAQSYSYKIKFFHWLMASIILAIAFLGFYMVSITYSPLKLSLYGWHKSFGTLILILLFFRVIVRFFSTKPNPIKNHKRWERLLSHFIHVLLYALMISLPLTGWLMSSAGDYAHSFFGLFNLPKIVEQNETLFNQMRIAHELCIYLLIAAVCLHIAGALKHHFIDKDKTLIRMLSKANSSSFSYILVFGLVFYFSAIGFVYFKNYMEHSNILKLLDADSKIFANEIKDKTLENQQIAIDKIHPGDLTHWDIDLNRSQLSFSVNVYNEPFEASFNTFGGSIYFEESNLSNSRAEIWIDMHSAISGSKDRDKYMKNAIWFNSESFPESRFLVNDFEKIKENQYVANGELHLKGVVIPLKLPFILEISKNEQNKREAIVSGNIVINRLDFAIGQGEWQDTSSVEDQVNVSISLVAHSNE